MTCALSIVIPARDEAEALRTVLPDLRQRFPDADIVVVDDGSGDDTAAVAAAAGVRIIRHPYGMGNGAAIKTGARSAFGGTVVFMDGDGQHRPEHIPKLLQELEAGCSMVVGARGALAHANPFRWLANGFYNRLASWITGRRIDDLTSGFRAVDAARFREFLHLLPNGFSYPTTITMAFLRAGYPVQFVPVPVERRIGRSHIRPVRDGIRFVLIIFKVGTLYSPLKIFIPASVVLFLGGAANYLHTYLSYGRFTNMSALLFVASLLVFLIGLVSEQITALMYQRRD